MTVEKIMEYGMAVRLRNKLEAETGKVHEIVVAGGCYIVREYRIEERRAA
jgi:hypothetical protein